MAARLAQILISGCCLVVVSAYDPTSSTPADASPDRMAHSGPRPLLVAFGGAGESGEDFVERAGLETFVDAGFARCPWHAATTGEVHVDLGGCP